MNLIEHSTVELCKNSSSQYSFLRHPENADYEKFRNVINLVPSAILLYNNPFRPADVPDPKTYNNNNVTKARRVHCFFVVDADHGLRGETGLTLSLRFEPQTERGREGGGGLSVWFSVLSEFSAGSFPPQRCASSARSLLRFFRGKSSPSMKFFPHWVESPERNKFTLIISTAVGKHYIDSLHSLSRFRTFFHRDVTWILFVDLCIDVWFWYMYVWIIHTWDACGLVSLLYIYLMSF